MGLKLGGGSGPEYRIDTSGDAAYPSGVCNRCHCIVAPEVICHDPPGDWEPLMYSPVHHKARRPLLRVTP